jgi:hypothetical protein
MSDILRHLRSMLEVVAEQQNDGCWTDNVGKWLRKRYKDELYMTGGCREWFTGANGKEKVAKKKNNREDWAYVVTEEAKVL